jgi:hypothetical protein
VGHAVSFFKSAAGAAGATLISAALWTAMGSRPSAATVSGDSNTCRWPLAATARTFARFSLLWSIISVNGYMLAAVIIACGIHVHGAQYWHIRNWSIKHAH